MAVNARHFLFEDEFLNTNMESLKLKSQIRVEVDQIRKRDKDEEDE